MSVIVNVWWCGCRCVQGFLFVGVGEWWMWGCVRGGVVDVCFFIALQSNRLLIKLFFCFVLFCFVFVGVVGAGVRWMRGWPQPDYSLPLNSITPFIFIFLPCHGSRLINQPDPDFP